MKCQGCGGKSDVVDSRPAGDMSVWRRRKCRDCASTWITWEMPDGVDDQDRAIMVAQLRTAANLLEAVRRDMESDGRRPR